jgi:hypothetical protein
MKARIATILLLAASAAHAGITTDPTALATAPGSLPQTQQAPQSAAPMSSLDVLRQMLQIQKEQAEQMLFMLQRIERLEQQCQCPATNQERPPQ